MDMQFTTKELSRGIYKPCVRDYRNLKRLGRYLIEKERCVMTFGDQNKLLDIKV